MLKRIFQFIDSDFTEVSMTWNNQLTVYRIALRDKSFLRNADAHFCKQRNMAKIIKKIKGKQHLIRADNSEINFSDDPQQVSKLNQ